jgi:hypothetical protein
MVLQIPFNADPLARDLGAGTWDLARKNQGPLAKSHTLDPKSFFPRFKFTS